MDKEIRLQIGKEYLEGKFNDDKDYIEKAYKEIARINEELFSKIPFRVVFTDDDTYKSAKEMRERVIAEEVIYIYKGGSDHEYFTEKENWIGRAVHDVFAHLVCGCPFSFIGEYNAYLEQRKYYPEWTYKVLFAEIPAQTASFYYSGGFNFKQKAIEAPQKWLDMCEQFKTDFSKNSVIDPLYFLQV